MPINILINGRNFLPKYSLQFFGPLKTMIKIAFSFTPNQQFDYFHFFYIILILIK